MEFDVVFDFSFHFVCAECRQNFAQANIEHLNWIEWENDKEHRTVAAKNANESDIIFIICSNKWYSNVCHVTMHFLNAIAVFYAEKHELINLHVIRSNW